MGQEAEFTISLSGVKERIIVYGFALLVGGSTVFDMVSPHGRADPFTGTQGEELADRITILELELEAVRDANYVCKQRLDNHLKVSEIKINEYDVRFARNEIRLDECLRRAGAMNNAY